MIRIPVLALLSLVMAPGLALAADPAAGSAPPLPGPSALPLAAMRHEPPDQQVVTQREDQRFGVPVVKREQTKEQQEVDQIYRDVMRRSAPPPGTPVPSDQP